MCLLEPAVLLGVKSDRRKIIEALFVCICARFSGNVMQEKHFLVIFVMSRLPEKNIKT